MVTLYISSQGKSVNILSKDNKSGICVMFSFCILSMSHVIVDDVDHQQTIEFFMKSNQSFCKNNASHTFCGTYWYWKEPEK